MKKLILYFIPFFVLLSCGSQKKAISETSTSTIESNSYKEFYSIISKKSNFDALKITSKINADFGNTIPSINATIYIENNQKVWINMSALFINMARGIATPQGLKAYEKIDRTYIDSDYTYLNQLLNVNFIDYSVLQNILLGRVFYPINENDFSLTQSEKGYLLSTKNAQKISVEGKSSEYFMDFEFSKDFDLNQVILKETKSDNTLQLHYENWTSINGQKLPKNVKIIIKGKKKGEILIENTKFDFSKMDTPYSVPNNYKKRDF